MHNILKETREKGCIKSRNSILINPNILADILVDLIKVKSNKNYVVCYGKNFIYLLMENKVNNIYHIHNVDDVIDYDGILIYKNRVNVCNTGEFDYIRDFIKYLLEYSNIKEIDDINQLLEGFIKQDKNKSGTMVLRRKLS